MSDDIFTDEDIAQGEESPVLGPEYFAARRFAERFMEKFAAEHFQPLIDQFAQEFRDKLWSDVADWLVMDTETNIHQQIRNMVDRTVNALLKGEKWAADHYPLSTLYDAEKIRAAIAVHLPEQIRAGRIADLEAENAKLRQDIDWYRKMRG